MFKEPPKQILLQKPRWSKWEMGRLEGGVLSLPGGKRLLLAEMRGGDGKKAEMDNGHK